ncbi:MAG: hypothetical protein OXU45_10140 [Candidatus Melainabacteria bacterium]|nr:hypothetical protein [Candidatus Melainabacteria bacterium]
MNLEITGSEARLIARASTQRDATSPASTEAKSLNRGELISAVAKLLEKPISRADELLDLIDDSLNLLEGNYSSCDKVVLSQVLESISRSMTPALRQKLEQYGFISATMKLTNFLRRFLNDRDKASDLYLLACFCSAAERFKLGARYDPDSSLADQVFTRATHLMSSVTEDAAGQKLLQRRTLMLLCNGLRSLRPNPKTARSFLRALCRFTNFKNCQDFFGPGAANNLCTSIHDNRFDEANEENFAIVPFQLLNDLARTIKRYIEEGSWYEKQSVYSLSGLRETCTAEARPIKEACLRQLTIPEIKDAKFLCILLTFFRASILNGEFDQNPSLYIAKFVDTLNTLSEVPCPPNNKRIAMRELSLLQFYLDKRNDHFSKSLRQVTLELSNKLGWKEEAQQATEEILKQERISENLVLELISPSLSSAGLSARKAKVTDLQDCFFDLDLVVEQNGKVLANIEVDGISHNSDTDIPDSLRDKFIKDKYGLPVFRVEVGSNCTIANPGLLEETVSKIKALAS